MQTVVARKQKENASGGEQRTGTALNVGSSRGKITVFTKSKNVCVGTRTINLLQANNGLTPSVVVVPQRIPVYERVLDDVKKAVLEMAKDQAKFFGAELEVNDEGKLGFARLLDVISGHRLLPKAPFVSYSGNLKSLTGCEISFDCKNAVEVI